MPDEPEWPGPLPDVTVGDIDTAPEKADAGEGAYPVTVEELQAAFTRVSNARDQLQTELDETKRRVNTIEILDSLIRPYAERTFIFMCAYCGFVGFYLLLYATGQFTIYPPASVLGFLVGSTAATVIGLVGMVLTGIFIGARRRP